MPRLLAMVAMVFCVALLLAAVPEGVLAQPSDATISFQVSGSDGLPIGGATIEVSVLRGQTYRFVTNLTTDPAGTVDYTTRAGSYQFVISAPHSDPETIYLIAERRESYALDITLQSYGSIEGTVFDTSTGLPIPGATVDFYLRDPDGGWPSEPSESITAADGTYAMGTLPTGSYRVYATAPGYSAGFFDSFGLGTPTTVVVNRGSERTGIDIFLTSSAQSGWITGRVVTGANATPMGSAYVFIYRQNDDGTWPATSPGWGDPTRTVFTDATGNYTSGELPLGNYKVRFFTVHTGSQWWEYVTSVDLATVVTLEAPGQTLTGIDGWFNKP